MRWHRAWGPAVAPVLAAPMLALLQATAWSTPAAADPVSDCSTTVGTIVAVDFSPWTDTVERGCAVQLSTEYAAMHAAGFTTAGDGTDGPAFVCRIDDDPPPSVQPCLTTPPADAYWSFWYADAGQDNWTYSEQGAMDFEPQPGSVTAWIFGSTSTRPPVPPSALRATNTSPTTTTAAPPTSSATTSTFAGTTTTTTGSTSTTSPAATTTSTIGNNTSTTVPSATSTTRPASGARPTTTVATSGGKGGDAAGPGRQASPRIVDVAPTAGHGTAGPSPGSPLPLVVGGVLAASLAAAGLVVARRRRRA
jgi:hypothetical protein